MAAAPWIVSDELWELVEPLLPKRERRFRSPGRKRLPDRDALQGDLVLAAHGDRLAAAAPGRRRASAWRLRQETLTRLASQVILTRMVEPGEVVAQTASEDPEIGLRGVASLRALLEAVEELQVRRARERGWSWQQIAALLGVSKQAVHQKYGKGEPRKRRRLR